MNSSKQVICSERMRQVPAQFSWVDQRLARDRHLDRLDAYAAALYLFLVTVADCKGLSWYGDTSTARRLSIDEARLRRARGGTQAPCSTACSARGGLDSMLSTRMR